MTQMNTAIRTDNLANRWNRPKLRTWFLSVLSVAGQPLFDDAFSKPTVFGYMSFNKEEVLTKKEK